MDTTRTDALVPRMLPDLTAVNRAYWTGGADGQLLIQWCEPCARWNHPPSAQCPECDGPLDARPVSGRGTVFTSTINVHPYSPDVPTPYVIALVQLDEQDDLRLVTNIVHCEPTDVAIGMSVQVLFEQHGEIFVPLFELALQ